MIICIVQTFIKWFSQRFLNLKFKIVFQRPKSEDWSCFESKCVSKIIKDQFPKYGFKRLEKDWIGAGFSEFCRMPNTQSNLINCLSNAQLYLDERIWLCQI